MSKRAFSIFELLVVISLSSLVMLAALGLFTRSTKIQNDVEVLTQIQSNSSILMSLLGREIQNIGTGMALNLDSMKSKNSNFDVSNTIGGAYTLQQSDLLPLLYDGCTDTQLAYRQNSSGKIYTLTADFNPVNGAMNTIELDTNEGLADQQRFLISGKNSGTEFVLYGVVKDHNSDGVSIDVPNMLRSRIYNPAGNQRAEFKAGDTLEPIDEIYLYSNADNTITRRVKRGVFLPEIVLAENTNIDFKYLTDSRYRPFDLSSYTHVFYQHGAASAERAGYMIFDNLTGVQVILRSSSHKKRRIGAKESLDSITKTRNFAIRSLKTVL